MGMTDPAAIRAALILFALILQAGGPAAAGIDDDDEEREAAAARREEELAKKNAALRERLREPVLLEARSFRLFIDRSDGTFRLEDRQTGIDWNTPLDRRGFASVILPADDAGAPPRELPLDRAGGIQADGSSIRFTARSSAGEAPRIAFRFAITEPLAGLEIAVEMEKELFERGAAVKILDRALWISDADAGGGALLPVGLGEWRAAEGEEAFRERLEPGGPSSPLAGIGLLRRDAGLLLAAAAPGTAVEVERREVADPAFPGKRALSTTVLLRGGARSIRLFPLGRAEPKDLPSSYRQIAAGEEFPETLRSKTGGEARHRSLAGAAVFRPGAAALESGDAVRFAERLRELLGIDEALFILEAPGTGPERAAEEEALARSAGRLRELGYLLGLEVAAGGAAADLDALREGLLDLRRRIPFDLLFTGAGAEAPPAARLDLQAALGRDFRLLGAEFLGEEQFRHSSYLEGALDHRALNRDGGRFYPFLPMVYGNCARLAVSPGEAVGPDEPGKLLAHVLLGEVPLYRVPGPEGAGGAPPDPDLAVFSRSDGGWGEGKGLGAAELFIKNTCEALGELARLRFREPLFFYRKVTPDGAVEEAYYGFDLRVVVNNGPREYRDDEWNFTLPQYGFWIHHPLFVAFHATRAFEVEYDRPALFTVRSLEGKLYLRAEKVRIWHGFGPDRIRLGGRDFTVPRESEVRIW